MNCHQYLSSFLSSVLQRIFIDGSGVLLNSMCVVCFAQILWYKRESKVNNKANMFKFLFVKAVCDLLIFGDKTIDLMYYYCTFVYTNCRLHTTPYYLYWNIYSNNYMTSVAIMVSSLMEVAATLGNRKLPLFLIKSIIAESIFSLNAQWACFHSIALWFFDLFYVTPFFIYYLFNIHFKTFAHKNFKIVLNPIFFVARKVNMHRQTI
jgi:hypothetical protein